LNFIALFLTAMNRPPSLLRLVEVPVRALFNWVHFFTAPSGAFPIGLLTAIGVPPVARPRRAGTRLLRCLSEHH